MFIVHRVIDRWNSDINTVDHLKTRRTERNPTEIQFNWQSRHRTSEYLDPPSTRNVFKAFCPPHFYIR